MQGENLWHAEVCCSDVPSSEQGGVMALRCQIQGESTFLPGLPPPAGRAEHGGHGPAMVLDSSTASLCCGAPSAHTAVSPNSLSTSYPVLSASWRAQVHRGQVPLLKGWMVREAPLGRRAKTYRSNRQPGDGLEGAASRQRGHAWSGGRGVGACAPAAGAESGGRGTGRMCSSRHRKDAEWETRRV